MSKFSVILFIALASCCLPSASDDHPQVSRSQVPVPQEPKIVPISDDEFESALERLRQPKDADKIGGLVIEALSSLGTKEVCLLTLGTDSINPGPGNWRSCASVGNKPAFSIPKNYGAVFVGEQKLCSDDPNGVLSVIFVALPESDARSENAPFTSPSSGSELMTVRVGSFECMTLK